jgi:hypothetical protein
MIFAFYPAQVKLVIIIGLWDNFNDLKDHDNYQKKYRLFAPGRRFNHACYFTDPGRTTILKQQFILGGGRYGLCYFFFLSAAARDRAEDRRPFVVPG